MATFVLTATRPIDHPASHIHIDQGAQFKISIFDGSTRASNLFSNRANQPNIITQFQAQGLSGLPSTSVALTSSPWRIKQI